MDGAATSSAGPVRRRHSSHGNMSDNAESQNQESSRPTIIEDPRRSASVNTPHVRFSTDVMRKAKKRRSDEALGPEDSHQYSHGRAQSHDAGVVRRATAPNLENDRSTSQVARNASSSTPRNRGMSLRSSLFMRHMSTADNSHEMQAFESPFASASGTADTSDTKKQSRAIVTEVAPDELGSLPEYKPSNKRQRPPSSQQWIEKQANRYLPLESLQSAFESARKFVLRIQDVPPSANGRQIPFDAYRKQPLIDERVGRPFISNIIRSSKYTPWNFVPRQLIAQFGKFANFYFLVISIMQMIPGLSTTGNYTTIIPLFFFVSLSMAKEGYEDLRRHRLDKDENNRYVDVLHAYNARTTTDEAQRAVQLNGPIHWGRVKWQALQVGDIVRLERDEAVPADIIVLGSKGSNNSAFVETMALDGETNLKNKQPLAAAAAVSNSLESLATATMHLTVEDPNLDLYNFEGKLAINDQTHPLTNNEVIYRGSVLRNTPEIVGIVIYSGEECKIRMNSNKNPRIKAPSLQARVNRVVLIIVCIVLFLTIFNAAGYSIWRQNHVAKDAWYLHRTGVPITHIVTGYIIMFNTMIPLSLYVSMEIIKICQMFLLNDVDMYDAETNTPFEARTSTINEELGQVGYIFSDKTGTLTENIMRFRKMSVAGAAWVHDGIVQEQNTEETILMHKKRGSRSKGKEPVHLGRKSFSSSPLRSTTHEIDASKRREESPVPQRQKSVSQWKASAMPEMARATRSTQEMIRFIQQRPATHLAQKLKMMIISMAVCHTCLPERSGEKDEDVTFQASSPDELALVEAAKELGFIAFSRDVSTLTLKLTPNGSDGDPVFETYEILDVIEFSSKRKRMSVLVRFPDGRFSVLCKGADSVIMSRLRRSNLANQVLSKIEQKVMSRKSMEAEIALRRKSSQFERKASIGHFPRTSVSLGQSNTPITRSSVTRLAATRDDVDEWLTERENDVPVTPTLQLPPRPSLALSERPLSISQLDIELAGIEETMTTDEVAELERCLQHVTDFATEGLRTLLYGYRFLDEQEYRSWKKIYHDATTSLVNRQMLIERAGELIEQQLELGGATAIEDKLQKGVPETIDRLRRANIKMWMLTGDKRETAINIGHSCGLIKDYSSLTVLDHEAGNIEHNIAQSIVDINRGDIAHSVVVIDGQTLANIEYDMSLLALFVDLAILADSVICCRASPSQKAGLVNAIRERVPGSVTLAIGDGANDIAMIQEAHVGIGITGKEGLQAARTSDYAIAQFRFLTKLLLVHGRWNYIRTCKYTLATFWKEFMFFITAAYFQHFTGYTGTSLYEQWSLSMFNTLFTSLVVIFLGVFEQDLRASTLIAVPELYTKGQRSLGFNLKVFAGWIFMGLVDSLIIFFTMTELYARAGSLQTPGLFPIGQLTFTGCVIVIALKTQVIEQRYRSYMAAIAIFASVGGWFLWNIILSAIYGKNNQYDVKGGFLVRFGRSGLWWLVLVFAVSSCLLFEIAVRALKSALMPTDVEIFQTLEQDLAVRKRFEEASAPWLQAGWHHGSKKSSVELLRRAEEDDEQRARELEVQELLRHPRDLEDGHGPGPKGLAGVVQTEERVVVDRDGNDIQDILARRQNSLHLK